MLQSEVDRVKDALGKHALELESAGTNFIARDKCALAREEDRVNCAGVGRDVLQIELQEPLRGMLQINQRMLQLIHEVGVEERAGGNYPQRSEPLQNILEGHQLQGLHPEPAPIRPYLKASCSSLYRQYASMAYASISPLQLTLLPHTSNQGFVCV